MFGIDAMVWRQSGTLYLPIVIIVYVITFFFTELFEQNKII